MKDYAKVDTSEKMNRYEMAYYSIIFLIVLVGVTIVLPAVMIGLI